MPESTASDNERGRSNRAGVLVVAGPAGSGKTTVGRLVAERLGWAFEDADDFHSEEARLKMARGEGLTDADRAPWLANLRRLVQARVEEGPPTVLACSALKRAYRDRLLVPGARLVWLEVPAAALRERLQRRGGHFAGADLLPSQLATAEPPASDEEAGVVDGAEDVQTVARDVAAKAVGKMCA